MGSGQSGYSQAEMDEQQKKHEQQMESARMQMMQENEAENNRREQEMEALAAESKKRLDELEMKNNHAIEIIKLTNENKEKEMERQQAVMKSFMDQQGKDAKDANLRFKAMQKEYAEDKRLANEEKKRMHKEMLLARKESDKKVALLMTQVIAAQKNAKNTMDPKKYDEFESKHYSKFIDAVSKMRDPPKTKEFSVAFLGKTCAGKTTLINTLVGKTVGRPSVLQNTEGITMVWSKFKDIEIKCDSGEEDVILFDVFGTNDEKTYHNFQTLLELKKIHLVVCLYTGCVEDVKKMALLLNATKCAVHFSFSKIDTVFPVSDRDVLLKNDTTALQKFCMGSTVGQHSSLKKIGIEMLRKKCKLNNLKRK